MISPLLTSSDFCRCVISYLNCPLVGKPGGDERGNIYMEYQNQNAWAITLISHCNMLCHVASMMIVHTTHFNAIVFN